jgi:MFS family permease
MRNRHPMLDLSLFRNPAFNGVSVVACLLSAGMFALFLYLTIYMQGVLDYSPLEAGVRFLPQTILTFVASIFAGSLLNRVAVRTLFGAGLGLVGIGLLLMHGITPGSSWTTLLAGFLVSGVGVGIVNPAIGQAAIAVVPPEKSGMGSGINSTFRQVGIATGVAALGAVFQSQIDSKLGEVLPRAPHGLGEIVASGGSRAVGALRLPPGIEAKAVQASDVAFVHALNSILLIAAILSFVGAIAGFALTRSSHFVQASEGDSPGPGAANSAPDVA